MFWGADTTQLTAFGSDASGRASALEGRCGTLGALIGSVTWAGQDADEFRARWEQTSRMMLTVSEELGRRSEQARQHAEEQDQASTPGGGEGAGEDGAGDGRAPVPRPAEDAEPPVEHHDDIPEVLSDEEYQELADLLAEANGNGNWWEVWRNDGDAAADLAEKLQGLSPAQLDDFLNRSSTEDLTGFADALRQDGRDGGWFSSGDDWNYIETWSDLLRSADPALRDKIHGAFPESKPDTTTYKDDEERGRVVNGSFEYATPGDAELFTDAEVQQRILDQYRQNRTDNPGADETGYEPWMDVNQQGYGDCWMLANLTAVVYDDPSWPQEHVVHNGDGTVTVTLYDADGNPRDITVTDDLPARGNGGYQGAYGGPDGAGFGDGDASALWPAYVEKAMAASFQDDSTYDPGQYEVIVGGSEEAAPYFQPGGAAESVELPDIGSRFDSSGDPVVVSTPNSDDSSEAAKSDPNYVSSHQYVLTDSYTVDGQTYYEFHNPHGMGATPLVLTPDEFDDYFRAARTY